jgi:uncharacterized protein YjbJ (UPF0337 family)
VKWERIEAQWRLFTMQVKARWGLLTDDDLKTLTADKHDLVAKIQRRYGVMREEAEDDIEAWGRELQAEDARQRSGTEQ